MPVKHNQKIDNETGYDSYKIVNQFGFGHEGPRFALLTAARSMVAKTRKAPKRKIDARSPLIVICANAQIFTDISIGFLTFDLI